MMKKATFDIVLLGGGIAGLWALNRLKQLGLNCALFEANTLGGGQTLHSQGIIHGGIKYALTGFLSNASSEVADMPNRWKRCLGVGGGEIDLSSVNILSQDQLLWSTGRLTSDLITFFASKALQSRIQSLKSSQYPEALQNPNFKGRVYRLEEIVLDTLSLVQSLARPIQNNIFKIDKHYGCEIQYCDMHGMQNTHATGALHDRYDTHTTSEKNKIPAIKSMIMKNGSDFVEVTAKRYVFTAGEGNENLLQTFTDAPEMQRRPLHMVMVKMPKALPFYAHCMDNGVNPRITITSHKSNDDKCIWYLGGQIAEEGVNRTQMEQITFTKQELKKLFPHINFTDTEYSSFMINRAEVKGKDGKRPDSFFLETKKNMTVAWPTKLALTPLLVDALISSLEKEAILKLSSASSLSQDNNKLTDIETYTALKDWEKPKVGQPPWEKMEFICSNED